MQRVLSRQIAATRFLRTNSPQILVNHRFASSEAAGNNKEHVVRNNDELDVQSKASHSGMKEREQGSSGSSAISSKDDTNSKQKAKEEHPEAPDLIGMEDERE